MSALSKRSIHIKNFRNSGNWKQGASVQAITGEVRGVRPPRQRTSFVKVLLASTALVTVVMSTSVARADGGRGGGSFVPDVGGAGGIGNSGAAGGNGIPISTNVN